MSKLTIQQARSKAAKKAARTRALNVAMRKRWEQIDRPAQERFITLCNELLQCGNFDVRWKPLIDNRESLKHGVQRGRIIKFVTPYIVRVLPDGYKRPQDFHWSFWEPILEPDPESLEGK